MSCRAEAVFSRCDRRHVSSPQFGKTEAAQGSLVPGESALPATWWVISRTNSFFHYMSSDLLYCLFLQTLWMSILGTQWLSTSAFSISTPGLCSHQQFWVCPSHTSQVHFSQCTTNYSVLQNKARVKLGFNVFILDKKENTSRKEAEAPSQFLWGRIWFSGVIL